MSIPFYSVNGLAGGLELGCVEAGFDLVHRTGSLDLGAPLVESNRKLFGWDWDSEFTGKRQLWRQIDAPFLASNPPCSGFSTLTRKDLRGADAKVMQYTDEVFDFAAFQKKPPLVIAIESVQQAFSTGRAYYQQKRTELEEKTGKKYDLIWLFQSNQSLGGASVRKRVFVVLSQIPFGVEYAQPDRVARFGDAVRDLEGLDLTMSKQPYRRPPTWWSTSRRAADGVDGHFNDPRVNSWYSELMHLAEECGHPWSVGEPLENVLRRVYVTRGELPHEWQRQIQKLTAKNFSLGINQTGCWDPEKQGRVVTGTGPALSVHYSEKRLLTYREVFRLQGFPDTYRLWTARNYNKIGACAGKGVPVHAGHWLGVWAKCALDGNPGTIQGETIGDRERKADMTNSWKWTVEYEAPYRYSRNTILEQQQLVA